MHRLNPWKVPFLCALAITSLPLALLLLARSGDAATRSGAGTPTSQPGGASGQTAMTEISLRDALGRHWVQAEYAGNGHSEIKALITSTYNVPIRLAIASGLIFETADFRHEMVVARGDTIELPPAAQRPVWLPCAATRTSNAVANQAYHLCPENLQYLNKLFAQADQSPEVSREAIQTAVLLLTENAPLEMFAEFTLLRPSQSARPMPTTYQVSTSEILASLELLKAAGYSRMNLTAAHQPQLKIEAMIDPLAHAAAMHYFGISPYLEWAFWRDQLQNGDPATRHYALYGIGRYYPEVALKMLPAWARATQLSPLLRTSAMQAMAETHRPEAVSVLQQLVSEFGAATELGQSGRKAIAYLENPRTAPAASSRLVESPLRRLPEIVAAIDRRWPAFYTKLRSASEFRRPSSRRAPHAARARCANRIRWRTPA